MNTLLTLERQAFDAEMRINNALDNISLEDVSVVVDFEDDAGNPVVATSDSSNTEASFFIRVASMDNVSAVDGTGTIGAGQTGVVNWLIIPASGAATVDTGSVYFVGATLTYTMNGEEQSITVVPDRIVVKPLPRLTLDYFLEREVVADDAFTPEIEPAVPFTLGVRVRNNGAATAENVNIESAQPTIVENDQGLAIGFEIINSFVSDSPVSPSLLINVGDVPPNESVMGRWNMVTTLSGEFTNFSASFTHADELGGELTSLLEATNTHFLIKDVRVDLAGRDSVLDFLAEDGADIVVYESNSVDSPVDNQSPTASMAFVQNTGAFQQYTLSLNAGTGFVFARITDSFNFNGNKVVHEAFRSDGKRIPLDNVWFSQTRNESNGFDHFFNIFDVNTTGEYTVVLADKVSVPQAPALQFIPDRRLVEGETISFLVEASDPNGTIPAISANPLPASAVFALDNTDNNVATYTFTWTPDVGGAGRYEINYVASDGELTSSRRAWLDVLSSNDSDNDGMDDDWELAQFGTLDRDGTGDFDGDGISDLDEFLQGSDPRSGPGTGPSTPILESPLYAAEVNTLVPVLTVQNSSITPEAPLQYEFELYSDEAMNTLLQQVIVSEAIGTTTSYTSSENLNENTHYWWRARATDGVLSSEWVAGEFFVNSLEEAPGAFSVTAPSEGADVTSLTPSLSVTNAVDPDGDVLTYVFEIFADDTMSDALVTSDAVVSGSEGTTEWQVPDSILSDNTLYYWQATATDDSTLNSVTPSATFFTNTQNDPPGALEIVAPSDGAVLVVDSVTLQVSEAIDPDNSSLLYEFELDTLNTFDSANLVRSGQVANTSFALSGLVEDQHYFWRARATDGFASSVWLSAHFLVNASNTPPPTPTISNPGDGAWVATMTPTLSLNTVSDGDGDAVTYHYELFADELMSTPLQSLSAHGASWLLDTPLQDNSWVYWRVAAEDATGAMSDWSAISRFFVNQDNVDNVPSFEFVSPTDATTVDSGSISIHWNDTDPDSSATIALYFDLDSYGADGNVMVSNLSEDDDGASDSYVWDVSGLEDGDYYIYAVIEDDSSSETIYSSAVITVENAPEAPNSAPVAINDSISGPQDTDIVVSFDDLFVNDSDPDNDVLTIDTAFDAEHGFPYVDAVARTIRYVPNPGFYGDDMFFYQLSDGRGGLAWGRVNVLVEATGQNFEPEPRADVFTTEMDSPLVVSFDDLTANDYDLNGDQLEVDFAFDNINGWLSTNNLTRTVTFTPDPGYTGPAEFIYQVSDGNGGLGWARVDIAVTTVGPNDDPIAMNDDISTEQDSSVVIEFSRLLANDTDPNFDLISVDFADDAEFGYFTTDHQLGTFTFVPEAGFSGTASFVYQISDGRGGLAWARANILVYVGPNVAPNAVDDMISTAQDASVVIPFSLLLENDSDANGQAVKVDLIDDTTNGTIQVDRELQQVTFTPDVGFVGEAGFIYQVSDDDGGISWATMTITVGP